MTSTWEAELLRKANQLDTEHATQVRLIDQLLAALEAEDRPRAAVLFGQALENSSLHFAEEEALMRQHTDPRASAHAGEHRRMLEALRTLEQRHRAGEAVKDEVATLRAEVTVHIQTLDRDFAAYLAADRLKA